MHGYLVVALNAHQFKNSQCKSIIETYGGNYLSHLIYSGDKDVFMHDSEQAFLMYRYKSNALVLGDQLEIQHHSNHCWMISIVMLKSWVMMSFSIKYLIVLCRCIKFWKSIFKLGEEAIIDLTQFTTSGKTTWF